MLMVKQMKNKGRIIEQQEVEGKKDSRRSRSQWM